MAVGSPSLDRGLFVFLVCLFAVCIGGQQPCKKVDDCRCEIDNKSTIDLTSLQLDYKIPRFEEKIEAENQTDTIWYNPCRGFQKLDVNKSGDCAQDVAVCLGLPGNLTKGLGLPNAEFIYDSNVRSYAVNYRYKDVTSRVYLQCAPKGTETILTAKAINETFYNMTLVSPVSCLVEEPKKKGLSPGSVILILIAVVSLVYVFGGIIYLGCFQGAVGLEVIPNLEFWLDLPLLVRDGIMFLVSGCKPSVAYDRI